MGLDQKPEAVGNLSLKLLDGLILEFRDGAAVRTDQAIVVLPFIHMLVPGLAVAELYFIGDPCLGKELEGTVDRGIADARMPGPKLQVELLDAHVALGREKGLEDDVP